MKAHLITGATGFVGSHLSAFLGRHHVAVRSLARRPPADSSSSLSVCLDLETASEFELIEALKGVDTVIHLAARAHILRERAADPLTAFRQANVAVSRKLARAAATAGVRRFVYLSSIGVHGAASPMRGRVPVPFTESSALAPHDAYSLSKLEGERTIQEVADVSGLEYVIIRPPLVIGPRVGGNMIRLLRLIQRGLPLPLGSADMPRSFIGIENLCSFIANCLTNPAAAGRTFVVADTEAPTTREFVLRLAANMGVSARIFSFPKPLLRLAADAAGRRRDYVRLFSPLTIDSSAARSLGWVPQVPLEQTIQDMVKWFLRQ